MRKLDDEAAKLKAQLSRAIQKVSRQNDAVARLDGSSPKHLEDEQLLNAMRLNEAEIAFNRALLEYERDSIESDATKR